MREAPASIGAFCPAAVPATDHNKTLGRSGRSKAIIRNIIIPDGAGSSAGDCFLSAGAGIVWGEALKNTGIPIKIYRYE